MTPTAERTRQDSSNLAPSTSSSVSITALVVMLLAGVTLLGVGGMAALLFTTRSSAPHTPAPPVYATSAPTSPMGGPATAAPSAAASLERWKFFGSMNNLCLVDANGDGIVDVAGAGTTFSGQSGVAMVDGRDGALIWRTNTSSPVNTLHCMGKAKLIVSHNNTKLERLDPATGNEVWSVDLTDRFQLLSSGDKCVSIKSIDEKSMNLDYATGKPAPCKVNELQESWLKRRERWEKQGVQIGTVTIKVTRTKPGTPHQQIEATRAGRTLWSKVLPIEPETFVDPAAGDNGVLVGGHTLDTHEIAFSYLNAETGDVMASFEEHGESDAISGLAVANQTLFVLSRKALRAFDSTSSKELWQVGRP